MPSFIESMGLEARIRVLEGAVRQEHEHTLGSLRLQASGLELVLKIMESIENRLIALEQQLGVRENDAADRTEGGA